MRSYSSNVWEDVLWPNISGDVVGGGTPSITNLATGCFEFNKLIASKTLGSSYGESQSLLQSFIASHSNGIYGSSSTIQPKSLTTIYIVKT